MFCRVTGTSVPRLFFVGTVSVAVAFAALLVGPVVSVEAQNVVRVEEDWELVIGDPDPLSDAPQVTCVMSPVGNLDSYYATLDLNHQSLPSFVAGGLQLQLWEGEYNLESRNFPGKGMMMSQGETVTWTQSMQLSGTNLTFEITDGNANYWGSFGGQGYLKTNIVTTLLNLNGYDPNVSVNHSGIGYASNRVQSLVLKAVRVYTESGDMAEDTTARVVHMLDD